MQIPVFFGENIRNVTVILEKFYKLKKLTLYWITMKFFKKINEKVGFKKTKFCLTF